MKNRASRFVLPALLGCALGAVPSFSLAAPGDVTAFNANLYNPPLSGSVQIADVLPFQNGKVLVGGRFQTVNGVSSPFLTMLNANGTKASNPVASIDGNLLGMLEQPDGRVIIYGTFSTVGGVYKPRLARLFPDGSLDSAYSPPVFDGITYRLALQADGKLLVGGDFSTVNGSAGYGIVRLNTDGSVDTSLTSPFTSAATVDAIVVQADGKIILGSRNTNVAGSGHDYIARLNADGSVDTGFDADATTDGPVHALAIQADGDVLVGGDFYTIGGVSQGALARLNSDGSLDSGFAPAITFSTVNAFIGGVNSIQVQTDGKILLCGYFTVVNSTSLQGVALLNANGTNATFNNPLVGASGSEFATIAELTASGSILVGGRFSSVDSVTRVGLAELENGVASQSLTLPLDTEAEWLRSGAEQEIPSVELSVSEDGSQTWTSLGAATRISGGWEKTGLTLPEAGYLRARQSGSMNITQGYEEEMIAFSALTPGTLDSGFNPNAGAAVYAVAEQPDGKTIIGGVFTVMGGASHIRLARLNADGTVDTGFSASVTWPSAPPQVHAAVVQPDGKILVCGEFNTVNGTSRSHIARLNANGTLDTGFNVTANIAIHNMVLQPDGKILIGGEFTSINGTARGRIARLNSDGTLDTGFNPNASSFVRSIALQDDGKIVAGGVFGLMGGVSHSKIARLNSDGTLDSSFTTSINDDVLAVALQPDGKIIVGGTFTSVNGTARGRLARLNTDGTLDTTGFTTGTASGLNGYVYGLSVQADGRVYVSGAFATLAGTTRGRVGRVNANGSADTSTINPAVGGDYGFGVSVLKSGSAIVVGDFTGVQSTTRNRIARLDGDLPYQKLSVPNAGRVEWLRGGTSPETQVVWFELSTDGGSTWSNLGSGTRISGGWELTGLSLTSGKVRARAYTRGGKLTGSGGLVETVVDF